MLSNGESCLSQTLVAFNFAQKTTFERRNIHVEEEFSHVITE